MKRAARDASTVRARWLPTAGAAGLLGALVLLARLVWSPPSGVLLDGAIQGSLAALVAVGLALVWRASRIVNFAQADLGAVPANLALLFIVSLGWGFYVSVVVGLLAAALLGAIVEFVFIRRFFRAPRVIVTVATIGVTQILVGLGLLLPTWFDEITAASYEPPIDATFTFGGTVFDGNDVLVLLVVPLVLVALAAFLRFSSLGVALRAAAEHADRASLLGIPVKRLQMVVWSLSSVLAFVALFLEIGVRGATLGRALDPTLLLTALAAAVIGGMHRLPIIGAAAIGLGVVSQSVVYDWGNSASRDAVLAGLIVAGLVVARVRTTGRADEASTWQATREIQPVPTELRDLPEVRAARRVLIALGLAVVAIVPVLMSESRVRLATTIAIYALVALSLVVLTGWAGHVSLGQMAVVGIAGAVAGSLVTRQGWDLALVLVAGGVAGAAVLVAVGLPALRGGGLTLAVATLALALVTSSWLLNPRFSPVRDVLPEWTRPGAGRVERPSVLGIFDVRSETSYYVLSLAVLGLGVLAARGLRRSRTGRTLIAGRDNARAVASFGVAPRRAVITAFAVSGTFAGVAGALLQVQQQSLDLSLYEPEAGLQVFSTAVVGGLGSIGGVVLGAAYVRGVDWFLPAEWTFLATGAGLLLVLMLLPGGLGAAVGDARNAALRALARRRALRVPSLVADTRVEALVATPEMVAAVEEATDAPIAAELHP
ncbi:MAG TPA: ABC transporter permease [Acidimicrobiia bacterium]|nr:ABC transporter permease [Acidimicrobiia bacterium]